MSKTVICGDCGQKPENGTKPTPAPKKKCKAGLVIAICIAVVAIAVASVEAYYLFKQVPSVTGAANVTEEIPETDTEEITSETESVVVEDAVEDFESDCTPSGNTVYSCAFDGYLVIRREASSSSEKLGRFLNGPTGAEVLFEEGEWTMIDYKGCQGYVYSKYLQKTPTEEYYGSVDVDWLKGIWSGAGGYVLIIYDNGIFEYGYDYATSYGKYIMQNNEVVFTTYKVDPGLEGFNETLQIYEDENKLGDYTRVDFLVEEEEDMCGYGALSAEDYLKARKNAAELISDIK